MRCVLPLILCILVPLAGCKVDTAPKKLMVHSPGSEPVFRKAPRRGTYTLYEVSKAADGSEQRQTLMTSLLEKSERVGFTRDGQGRLVAMAGGDEPEVLRGDGTYLWQVQAQKGDIDSGKTALLVATVLTLEQR